MKTNNKQKSIPEKVFIQAASTLFKCNPDEIEIEMIVENKEGFCFYKEYVYKIITKDALREYLEQQIDDPDDVLHLFDFCWIDVIKFRVNIDYLIDAMANKIEDLEQAQMLLAAAVLSKGAPNPENVFWKVLWRIDKSGNLVSTTMRTAASICDMDDLINELLELRIEHGIDVYNMHQEGMFECVDVSTANKSYPLFYIYSSEI